MDQLRGKKAKEKASAFDLVDIVYVFVLAYDHVDVVRSTRFLLCYVAFPPSGSTYVLYYNIIHDL